MRPPDVKPAALAGAAGDGTHATNDTAKPNTPATGLAIHPLALAIPEMLRDEYLELVADIKRHGVKQPLVIFEGKILDGRHRYRACTELGKSPNVTVFTGSSEAAKALVLSLNVHRRHLTFEQKTKIVAAELKRDPGQSDRAIASKAKVSPTTVGTKRKELVDSGELSTVDSSTGKDGKVRPRNPKPTWRERQGLPPPLPQSPTAKAATRGAPATKETLAAGWHDDNAAIRNALADRYRRYDPATQQQAARHLRELIELSYISKGHQRPKRWAANGAKVVYCTFCNKSDVEISILIGGYSTAFICNECVDLCNEIIRKQAGEAKAPVDQVVEATP